MSGPMKNVVFVGVYGCSASGKTRLSHDLNKELNAHKPLLFPISTDHFFDDAKCVELSTYEDPRCICWSRFLTCLESLKRVLEERDVLGESRDDEWWTALPPELQSYVIRPNTEEKKNTVAPSLPGPSPGAAPAAAAAETEEHEEAVESMDSSLMAHEEEDAQYTHSALQHTAPAATSTTLYVVCEGITLFTLPEVTNLFSFFFLVECEAEVAAVRRFLRAPRRVKHSRNKYHERIAQLCSYRTAARREELQKTFCELYKGGPNALLEPASFFPPLLRKVEGQDASVVEPKSEGAVTPPTVWWDTVSGQPTEAWMHFWDMYSSEGRPRPSADKVSVLRSPTELRWPRWPAQAREDLLRLLRKAPLPTERVDEQALLRRYAEFRYWFFFEVLYYHFLFLPIAVRNVESRVAALKCICNDTSNKNRGSLGDLFVFDNTPNDNESVYISQLKLFCDCIRLEQ